MLRFCLSILLSLASPLAAACPGVNLFDALPEATRAELRAAADAAPFARGLLWRATRGGQDLTLVGTYHFDDPRHAPILQRLGPELARASTLLVEAGPEEEAALMAEVGRNPDAMFSTGPTLPERMAEDDWQRLSATMAARGVPGVLTAKMKPWYVAMTLALSPCATAEVARGVKGLDGQLIAAAQARGLPIRALEPHDTVLTLFNDIPPAAQIDMILAALTAAEQADDYTQTLADAYFAEEPRLIWEFTRYETELHSGLSPEAAAEQIALSENLLMARRNRAWIPVIEAALADGPVLLAAGALHLPGETGLLALLEARGFALERLPLE